jgi:hypothetical protein
MAAEVTVSYRAVIDEVADLRQREDEVPPRTVARLRRELRRIGQRDFFPPPERDAAAAAVEGLAERQGASR